MKDHNVKRVAVVTSIGTGDSIQQAPLMFKILMKTVMKKTMLDKNNQEKLFLDESSLGSDLEYVGYFVMSPILFLFAATVLFDQGN